MLSTSLKKYLQFNSKEFHSLLKCYSILLVLAFCWLFWHIITLWKQPETLPPLLILPKAMQNHVELWKIPKIHLLGEYEIMDPNNLPEASLNIKLLGTFVAFPETFSFAVIQDGNDKQQLYRQGAMLSGYIKIEKILADRIIIKQNNQLEVIYLKKSDSIFGPPPAGLNGF